MPRIGRTRIVTLALLATALAGPALGDEPEKDERYVESHYTKYDYKIPMRDGVRLFTSVYVPKDRAEPRPILLNRTPYGAAPYGIDRYDASIGPSSFFSRAGYIIAVQDVRGCYLSEGKFVDIRPQLGRKGGPADIDESTDTYDTIDWLVGNVAGNNGRVGLWGISYPGFYAAAGAIDAHPALKAVSPQAPLVDWFLGDDVHHNGALFLQQEFNFDATFGLDRPAPTTKPNPPFDHGTGDAYRFFLELGPIRRADEAYFRGAHAHWNDVMAHGTYDDFWKARNLLPHLKGIRPAVMTVGGWFDAEDLYGPLHTYRTIEQTSKSENLLVMGPWSHGGWSLGDGDALGPARFRSKTAAYFRESVEFPFFEHHLRDRGEWSPPEAIVFETGRNQWHRLDAWPPAGAKPRPLYLRADGRLGFDPPPAGAAEFDEYASDPARPVPYTQTISISAPDTYMVEDQRFASRRNDVLTYQTEVLSEDLTVAGPVGVELVASTTGTDSDFVVKLIDVHPDAQPDPDADPADAGLPGYQQLVRGDVMRGKFRRSFEAPEPFVPGEPATVPFALQDVFHTFRPGHRLMVQVQSTWFPLVDRNPQTFVDIYRAGPADFRKATQRIYHAPGRASRLTLSVLP